MTIVGPNPRTQVGPPARWAMRGTALFARGAAWLALAVGLCVLLGWVLGAPVVKGAIGTPITIKANTGACFVVLGFSLLVTLHSARRRPAARAAALLVALVGGLTFLQHVTDWNFGIDQLLFREPPGEAATSSPGRMGPPASLSFLALGLSLLLLDVRTPGGHRPFRYLPLLATLISMVSIVGYAFGSKELYSAMRRTEIAWPTAVTILFLSIGVVFARRDSTLVRLLCAANVGGMAARRLLLPVLAIPFLLFLLYGGARDVGWVDAASGRGILAVIMMVALATVMLVTAYRLSNVAELEAQTAKQLRRSELRLNDFFEKAAVGLHWVGPDGIIQRANAADMALVGYEPDEYVGHHIAEFHADRHVIDELLRRLHAGEIVRDYPARLRCKDGSLKEVLIDSSVLWEEGRFVHTHCFTRDVTEQNKAELASRRLAAIVASTSDTIVGQDLNGIVRSWNRAAEQMFEYTAEEIIGQPITLLIPPDRLDEEQEFLARIRRGETIDQFESVRRRKDGQLINVSLTISPIRDAHGRVSGSSKIARDITERKRAEREREALLQSEREARAEAERAARMRDDFLAIVSHELRTPLNSILGWAQLLKRGSGDEKTLADGLDAIQHGARAQAQLIEDLLDMNRIITGKLPLNMQTVQLAPLIESAIATLRPAFEPRQIRVHTLLDATSGAVAGDASRLQQVVWNLVSNAVKFTPRGGRVDVLLQRAGSRIEITVRDTGIGIKPEFLPHVFERFRQADSSTTRQHGGLGLGLSIVKHLVELHGGTVRAESPGAGLGATFVVSLPLAPLRPAGAPAASDSRSVPELPGVDLSGVRILVVDDEPDTRELIRRVLTEFNAEVRTAASAAEALEALRQDTPHVLVSDIGMPVTDGYQFIRQVRQLPSESGGEVPAVALTAFARSEDRAKAMLAGYQMHVSKPAEPMELVATVASLAGRAFPSENTCQAEHRP